MALEDLKGGKLPRHVAIIMDGNARWAERHGRPKLEGYLKGIERAWNVVRLAKELGIGVLTFYVFSKENWRRPKEDVERLMALFEDYLVKEREKLFYEGVRLRVIGDLEDLSPRLRSLVLETVSLTSSNSAITVNLALSYSGRWEILQAVKRICEEVKRGRIGLEELDERAFSEFLLTSGVPDPDLMIRTSGEKRLSNFLLWQLAYTELYFTEVLWPDFSEDHFLEAIRDYQRRERRFGLDRSQIKELRGEG